MQTIKLISVLYKWIHQHILAELKFVIDKPDKTCLLFEIVRFSTYRLYIGWFKYSYLKR